MNNPNFPNLVKKHFEFLLTHHGFSNTSEKFTGFPLSEWIITLCSVELCVQVSIDKSQVFIDLGIPATNKEWFDLMYILMYITKNGQWKYSWPNGAINDEYYDNQLAHLAVILKENFDAIKKEVITITTDKIHRKSFQKFMRAHST
jgi:hypothetical protein